MKLLTYGYNNEEKVGVLCPCGDKVYPIEAFGLKYATMLELIQNITDDEFNMLKNEVAKRPEIGIPYQDVKKCAPIPCPDHDVFCLGLNYRDHAEESARFKKQAFGNQQQDAVYFSKRVDRASGDGDEIDGHFDVVDSLDYEVELGVILKKDAKKVPLEEAYDYVFGYTIINDVSARNVQTRHSQWYLGKSLDTFCPMGPWIVTADEFQTPLELDIISRVNGEVRQNSNTKYLIFNVDHVIHEASQAMTMQKGTVIAMGTPGGVGMGFVPPKFLKSGDVVECEIEKIGKISNRVQ